MNVNAFKEEDLPIKTIQKKQNRRPPEAHKFQGKDQSHGTGRRPYDLTPRWDEKVPPARRD